MHARRLSLLPRSLEHRPRRRSVRPAGAAGRCRSTTCSTPPSSSASRGSSSMTTTPCPTSRTCRPRRSSARPRRCGGSSPTRDSCAEFVAPRLWEHPNGIDGGYTSNDPAARTWAIERSKRAVDVAWRSAADLIVMWPAREGTAVRESKNPIAASGQMLAAIDAILAAQPEDPDRHRAQAQRAGRPRLRPHDRPCPGARRRSADPARVGVLIESAHAILAGLDPSDEMGFALAAGKLWSVHLNDQNGLKFDQDKVFGAANLRGAFDQVRVLEAAELRRHGRVRRLRREGPADAAGRVGHRPPRHEQGGVPAARREGADVSRAGRRAVHRRPRLRGARAARARASARRLIIRPRQSPCADVPLVAVILDAARAYDRLIIGGTRVASSSRAASTAAAWSLYVEEDPLQKLPDLAPLATARASSPTSTTGGWRGRSADSRSRSSASAAATAGTTPPPASPTSTPTTPRSAGSAPSTCWPAGSSTLAFYGYPAGRDDGLVAGAGEGVRGRRRGRRAGRAGHSPAGTATARRWEELQAELAGWLRRLPQPVGADGLQRRAGPPRARGLPRPRPTGAARRGRARRRQRSS